MARRGNWRVLGLGASVLVLLLGASLGSAGAAPQPLTHDSVRNAIYKPMGPSGVGRAVQLVDGNYSENLGDPVNGLSVRIGSLSTTGDFNGDGVPDLSIIMIEEGYTGNNWADIL